MKKYFDFLGASHRLMLTTIFALSNHYAPADLSLVMSGDLLPLLISACSKNALSVTSIRRAVSRESQESNLQLVLNVAGMRLCQILTVSVG